MRGMVVGEGGRSSGVLLYDKIEKTEPSTQYPVYPAPMHNIIMMLYYE